MDDNDLPVPVQALIDETIRALGGTGQYIIIARVDAGTARMVTNISPRTFVADVLRQMLAMEAN